MNPTMPPPPPPPRNPNPSSSSMPPPPPPKPSPPAPSAQPEAEDAPRPDASMAEADGSAKPSPSFSMPPPPPPRPSPQPEADAASEPDASADGSANPSPSVSGSSAGEAGNPGGDTEMAEAAPPEQRQQPRPRAPYAIPDWSAAPEHPFFLEVLKEGLIVEKLDVSKKGAYMFGRIDLCDFMLEHPTISRFHAVLQFRNDGQVFLYDLGSTHGSSINKTQA